MPESHEVLSLRGEVDGQRVSRVLKDRRTTIGALEDNDLQLSARGVSRRHAVVELDDDGGAVVTDVGSKNGTFVNGQRVERASIKPGDWLHVGPVPLMVELVDEDDAELAISISSGVEIEVARKPAEISSDTGTRSPVGSSLLGRLGLLDRLADRLIGAASPEVGRALAMLAGELGAIGGILVRWSGAGEPVVEAAWGDVPDLTERPSVVELFTAVHEEARRRPLVVCDRLGDAPPLSAAVAGGPMLDVRGLVLAGDQPRGDAALTMIQIALRMMIHAHPQPVHLEVPRTSTAVPELKIPEGYVIGRSDTVRSLYQQMRQLLRGHAPVLIVGETGVGKEHVARILHDSSKLEGAFVAVNCAAIPTELLEAELFGIERGVATGVTARPGKFQLAEKGTLFLDEIGDMDPLLQSKLLRVLQEMEVHPIGARTPQGVDVRVIAATNADLQRQIEAGRFRRDLYFRIAGYELRVPPLRERRVDIPLFVEHFMRRFATEAQKPVQGITVSALRSLQEAQWPGNVRELEHEVRRLVLQCPPNQAVDTTMLSERVLCPTIQLTAEDDGVLNVAARTEELERRLITLALARSKGNRSKAAKLLGISRNGLALKLERLGMDV